MKCLLFAIIAIILSGCATITTGTTQSILVDTFNAHGANCKGVDSKGREYYWPNTPSSTTVQKGDAPMVLTCEKPGFKKTVHTVDETLVGATFGNIILGGGVGILVDAVSGAAQKYPNIVKFPMEPDESAPQEVKTTYQNIKAELAKEKEFEKSESELEGDVYEIKPSEATASSSQVETSPSSVTKPVEQREELSIIEDRLQKLIELRQKNLITKEEYQETKRILLKNLTK